MHQGTFSHLRRSLTLSALYTAVHIPVNQKNPAAHLLYNGISFLYHAFILYCQIRHVQACLWHSCCEMHLLHRMAKSSSLRLNIHQITEYFQCSVCLVGQYAFCQYFTELYSFLVEGVYVPYEALEHDFVFEV